jgi:hypothetical protein
MNGASVGVLVLLLAGGAAAALALAGGPTGGMMGGRMDCASMHGGMMAGHAQCSQESRMGSHTSCDSMGMTPAQCREMQAYMAGSGMSGPCH